MNGVSGTGHPQVLAGLPNFHVHAIPNDREFLASFNASTGISAPLDFLNKQLWREDKYLGAHVSDLYRLVVMHLHGGVYVDMDAISIQVTYGSIPMLSPSPLLCYAVGPGQWQWLSLLSDCRTCADTRRGRRGWFQTAGRCPWARASRPTRASICATVSLPTSRAGS
jgi:hypothetical protein